MGVTLFWLKNNLGAIAFWVFELLHRTAANHLTKVQKLVIAVHPISAYDSPPVPLPYIKQKQCKVSNHWAQLCSNQEKIREAMAVLYLQHRHQSAVKSSKTIHSKTSNICTRFPTSAPPPYINQKLCKVNNHQSGC